MVENFDSNLIGQKALFNALYETYNAQFWHDFGQTKCDHPDHKKSPMNCPSRPPYTTPEGYGELIRDVVDSKGRTIKSGTTVRVTHASNMGCLDCTSDLNKEVGYELRLGLETPWLTNCRTKR